MAGELRCGACSAALPEGSRFCLKCGRPMGAAADTTTPDTSRSPSLASSDTVLADSEGALPPTRLPSGTKLSVYRIESVIGEGGMGVVYRAYDEARDRVVAVKCLHQNLAGNADIRRRFVREARVLRSWRHANVVTVHDLVERHRLR